MRTTYSLLCQSNPTCNVMDNVCVLHHSRTNHVVNYQICIMIMFVYIFAHAYMMCMFDDVYVLWTKKLLFSTIK